MSNSDVGFHIIKANMNKTNSKITFNEACKNEEGPQY